MTKRAFRSMLFLAAVALPTAAHPKEIAAPAAAAGPAVAAEFEANFAKFAALPGAAEPAAHAVDLDTFDPPIELPPAVTPIEGGVASYYGRRFNGRRTANGEVFDMHAMTAAHRTLPFGTKVRVTNPANGHSVTVRINDRGPFHGNRVIDVSRAAATELGLIGPGRGTVELAVVDE